MERGEEGGLGLAAVAALGNKARTTGPNSALKKIPMPWKGAAQAGWASVIGS